MDKERHFWPLMALTVLAGVGVGLLLAWQVWPVHWYDTDPSDLRQDHQMAYVALVADSLVVTGDAAAAQRQLYELVDDDTSPDQVGALVHRTMTNLRAEGNQAAALRVQRMIQQVGLPALPEDAAAPTPVAAKAPKEHEPIPTKTLYIGAIVLFVTALVLAAWGIVRLIKGQAEDRAYAVDPDEGYAPSFADDSQPGEPRPLANAGTWSTPDGPTDEMPLDYADEYPTDPESSPRQSTIGGGHAAHSAGPVAPTDTSQTDQAYGEGAAELQEIDISDGLDLYAKDMDAEVDRGEPDLRTHASASPQPPASMRTPQRESPHPAPTQPRPTARRRGNTLAVHRVQYRPSPIEFDRPHKIYTERNEFLGECGVGECDVLDAKGTLKVSALEVWLYDKTDMIHTNSTVRQILASRYVEVDKEMAARLSARGDWAIVEPGFTKTLETANMQAMITVQAVEYANDPDLPEAYFESVDVEVIVERR